MPMTKPLVSQLIGTFNGLFKSTSGGSVSVATAGTDYVSPDIRTNFSAPQRPSMTSSYLSPSANIITWYLTSNQILRVNFSSNINTINLVGLDSTLDGLQYQVVIRCLGGTSITWGSNFAWAGNVVPTPTTTSNRLDIFSFTVASPDNGTTWKMFNTGYVQNLY